MNKSDFHVENEVAVVNSMQSKHKKHPMN